MGKQKKQRKKRVAPPSGGKESHVSVADEEEGSSVTQRIKKKGRKKQVAPPAGGEASHVSAAVEDEASSDLEGARPPDAEEETEGSAGVEDEASSDSEEAPPLVVDEGPVVIVEDEGLSDSEEAPSARVEDETKAQVTVEAETAVPDRRDAAGGKGKDRRQYARFTVGGKTKGRVTASSDALILDISLGGARIEHAQVVRPGTLSFLDLELQGKTVRLKCRVIRSVVDRAEVQRDGERELVYHTGLQFIDPSDETRQLIGDYIQSVIKDS